MTGIAKARWTNQDNEIHIGIEFAKNGVNKAKRLVSGWATLDNEDTQGDIVTAEASAKAFARARGNLREMHKKDSAVGRIVSFREDTMTYKGKTYNGIFVTARVSEGAEDTWLKVLDGTLSGFSIGGSVNESEEIFAKSGQKIQKVTDYDLTELSLVDNPANPLADVTKFEKNIFTIHKAADGSVSEITGMAAEQDILNVFYCDIDEVGIAKSVDSATCPMCENLMKNIDFIEGTQDKDERVKRVIAKFVGTDEGGETMPKFTRLIKSVSASVVDPEGTEKEQVATGHDENDLAEIPTPARQDDVQEVKDDSNNELSEVHDDQEEISKQIDTLKSTIEGILNKSTLETHEKIVALEKAVGQASESFEKKFSELDSKFETLSEDLNITKSRQADVENTINKINSRGGMKKSVDGDDSTELEPTKSENDIWRGSVFDARSTFSVDSVFS